MNRKLLSAFAAAILLLAGCGNTSANEPQHSATTPTPESAVPTSTLPDVIEPTNTVESSGRVNVEDRLKGLKKNAYEGIEMSAEILQRKSILPGDVVPVTVLIKNTGDKTVLYTHGSSSSETPEALIVEVKGLQTIQPEDRLGVMTMDLQTNELKPGDELKFITYVMVIEPNEKFDEYTYEIYGSDKTYIGTIALPDLQNIYADIKAAATGSYDGKVYFAYSAEGVDTPAADTATLPANETTPQYIPSSENGYAVADFKITVTD